VIGDLSSFEIRRVAHFYKFQAEWLDYGAAMKALKKQKAAMPESGAPESGWPELEAHYRSAGVRYRELSAAAGAPLSPVAVGPPPLLPPPPVTHACCRKRLRTSGPPASSSPPPTVSEIRVGGAVRGYSVVCTQQHRDRNRPELVCRRDLLFGGNIRRHIAPEECRRRLLTWNLSGASLDGEQPRTDHQKLGGARLHEYATDAAY